MVEGRAAAPGSSHEPSSVITLLPGATAWTTLAPLPRKILDGVKASIVTGRLRVIGGNVDGYPSSQVQCVL